jgi:hypothetical protein
MGGWGSGPQRPLGKRRTVESCPGFGLSDLRADGPLTPGTRRSGVAQCLPVANPLGLAGWEYGRADSPTPVRYSLALRRTRGEARLCYRCPWVGDEVECLVPLATTRGHAGGLRWWLACPVRGCGRRAESVYLHAGWFACRRCHGLTYASTQNWDRRVQAFLRSGCDLDRLPDRSPSDLGFRLKVLDRQRRRFERHDRRVWR